MDRSPNEPQTPVGRALVATEKVFRGVALVLIFLMMLLGFLDVVLRYFFNAPILGVKELQTILLPVVTALALAGTQFDKAHIRVELLYDRFPRRVQRVLDYVALILPLTIWILIAWRSIVTGNSYMASNRTLNLVSIPIGYIQYIAAIGAALLCLEMLRQIICLLIGHSGKAENA